jgi:N-acetylglucosaminyldiphosphoundecaprenol N-acetyl-beta-D-mannosaminyltransferase
MIVPGNCATKQFETLTVLGVAMHLMDVDAATAIILEAAKQKRALSCSSVGMHTLTNAYRDPLVKLALACVDLKLIDSTPVYTLLRNRGYKSVHKVRGQDLLKSLCQKCEQENLSIFVLGTNEKSLSMLRTSLHERFPRLRIAGMKPGRYRVLTEAEVEEDIQDILECGAHIVFVGLGSPRQDLWVSTYASVVSRPLIAVGAALDFESGAVPVAPKLMQDMGLEWLHRLCSNPMRLWRRYLVDAPYFAWLLLTQKIDPGSPP